MTARDSNLRELVQRFCVDGRIAAIVLRLERHRPAVQVAEVRAEPGYGLIGDRRAIKRREGNTVRKRELTLKRCARRRNRFPTPDTMRLPAAIAVIAQSLM